ncbi:hypothetical protein HOE37_06465 [Candidatus Woesearchaeota archaeon]|jgi:hypothetical protein|nr:hypothetical protein [Candidatus Woesearchaeota archaeon]
MTVIKKKKKHYIDNKKFEELIQWFISEENKECKGDGVNEKETELMHMFDLLIDNLRKSYNFRVDPEDAKQDCFFLILRTLKKFSKEKGTAFNYFTTVIINNLKLIYSKNKRYAEKMADYKDHVIKKNEERNPSQK